MSDLNVNIHKVKKITLKGKLIPNSYDDKTFKVLDIKVERKDGQEDTISLFCEQDVELSIEPENLEHEIIIPWVKN